VKQAMHDKLIEHEQYIVRHGKDMPEVADWRWRSTGRPAGSSA
jgi:xylulose-5-phosphate/fructose-6-phosphate phosphoketolase